MSEKRELERVAAQGNVGVKKITDHEGEGLVIEWDRSDFKPTLISSGGQEKQMYDHVKSLVPDLKTAGTLTLSVESDENGFAVSIGKVNEKLVGLQEE